MSSKNLCLKIIFKGTLLYLLFMPFELKATEIRGYNVESEGYSSLVAEIARCTGFYIAARDSKKSLQLQTEIDEVEFSKEALKNGANLLRKAYKIMLRAEEQLSAEQRESLMLTREFSKGFGKGLGGSSYPLDFFASFLIDCAISAELINEN